MNVPNISVIIPVYNTEKYLQECLDSIVSQTLNKIEIICINDGSTDKSASILEHYATQDNRFVIVQQENSGSGIARNRGLSLATGEFIAFMDGDDYYPDNDVLRKMYDAATINNVLICGGGLSVNRNGITKTGKENGETYYFESNGTVDYAAVQYDYGYQRYIFSRKLLLEHRVYFPNYLRFQDPPFFARAMAISKKFYTLTVDTYCYRWGHQKINWNFRRVNDLVRGIRDNLQLSSEYELKILHEKCVQRLNHDYLFVIKESLDKRNPELPMLLYDTSILVKKEWTGIGNSSIRVFEEFLKNIYLETSTSKVMTTAEALQAQSEVILLRAEIANIRASTSYHIGCFITFIPRKIRGGIRCYQEHGVRYTINRVKSKIMRLLGVVK